ncbi:MAG: hypothetical protein H6828_03915 [Planctomycetes bacterium]|nr:hypothetical protein [Planctomycetota bacterium]
MRRLAARTCRFAVAALLALSLASRAAAHDGPPYPILVDEVLEGWTVSVWADPDVGTGTFYYYLDAPAGRTPAELLVEAHAEPADGTTPAVSGVSVAAEPSEPFQQIGTLEFHHRGTWPTRFVVSLPEEGRVLGELAFDLDVTPPGLGVFNLIWFAFPFLALALLWLRALFLQRAHDRGSSTLTRTEES